MFFVIVTFALVVVGFDVSGASCVKPLAKIGKFTYGEEPWRLVFVASEGTNKGVYDTWMKPSSSKPCPPSGTDPTIKCNCVWKSPDVDKWGNLNVKEVQVEYYKAGKTVAYVRFNGAGSSKTNWFNKGRLLGSGWNDLSKKSVSNYFSIEGHVIVPNMNRRFFINRNYGGCPNDRLWMVVADVHKGTKPVCAYDVAKGRPNFYYAPNSKIASIAGLHKAEQMAIYIR
ncbi:uncharacterized protein LOC141902057 [Tubulanus polymorphus]|uniref:uncharacterized protein LOC141902057 n=1 Tax=Tubulanus polymorphus TaxID=672921 RepID=UPI003DA43A3E